MELPHSAVCLTPRGDKHLVPLFKLFLLLLRVSKGLGHADARNTALQRGIDLRRGHAALHKGVAHTLAQAGCDENQEGDAGKNNKREPDVDGRKINKGKDHRDGGDQQIFGAVVRQLADVHKVTGHAGHDLARLVAIIKSVGQALKVAEHIRAHLCLHAHAHHVAVVLDKEIERHAHKVQDKQTHTRENDLTVGAVGDELVEHFPRDDGVDDAHECDQQSGQHVQRKDQFMGTVVADKSFEHTFSLCLSQKSTLYGPHGYDNTNFYFCQCMTQKISVDNVTVRQIECMVQHHPAQTTSERPCSACENYDERYKLCFA